MVQGRLSDIKRAELLARLSALEKLLADEAGQVKLIRAMGRDVAAAEARLLALQESRDRYLSALKHLLGDDLGENADPGDTGS